MNSGKNTREYTALRKLNVEVSTGVAGAINAVAGGLLGKSLVTPAIAEEAKYVFGGTPSHRASTLVSEGVMSRVELNTDDYYTFLDVLREASLDHVADMLEVECPPRGGTRREEERVEPIGATEIEQAPQTPPTASSQPPRGQGWPWETGRLEPQAMEVEPGGEKPASPDTSSRFPECDRRRVASDGDGVPHEYFKPYPVKKRRESVKLSFDTVRPTPGARGKQKGCYTMKRCPPPNPGEAEAHGVAVIINNKTFISRPDKERKGSEFDEQNTIETFRYLGYHIMVYRNITAKQMQDVFEWVRIQDHSRFDSFVCCIFSHGTDKGLRGSDWQLVKVEELAQSMNGRRCSTLRGKPKMFFIQACRGSLRDEGVAVSDSGDSPVELAPALKPSVDIAMEPAFILQLPAVSDSGDSSIPVQSDFFFGFATPPGYYSWRYEDRGTWYIIELCRELCSSSLGSHLADMHTTVQGVVSQQYKDKAIKMQPQHVSHLNGPVFFFPA